MPITLPQKEKMLAGAKAELQPARKDLKVVRGPTGEQLLLPGVDLPNVPRGTNEAITPPPMPGTSFNNQPSIPPLPSDSGSPPPLQPLQMRGGPSQIGLLPVQSEAPAQDMEGWVWGTMKHLASGTVFGLRDLVRGIIDIDAENKMLKEEMMPLMEEYRKGSPERQAEIEAQMGLIANKYADSWGEKFAQHGFTLAKDMAALTIQAPFKTVGRTLSFIDKVGKGITGELDENQLKSEWFKTLDNIVPIAIDALAFMGALKGVRAGLRGDIPAPYGPSSAKVEAGMKYAREGRPMDIGPEKGKIFSQEIMRPEVQELSKRAQNKIIRNELNAEKAQLFNQFKIIKDIEGKETARAIRETKELTAEKFQKAFATKMQKGKEIANGELAKLTSERNKIKGEYDNFLANKEKAFREYYDEIKGKGDFDFSEAKSDIEALKKEIAEAQTEAMSIKKTNPAEYKNRMEAVRELKNELTEKENQARIYDTIYGADYVERNFKNRLNTIDELIKAKINEIQAYTSKTRAEAIQKIKQSYAEQRQAIKKRIAEINEEIKRVGRGTYKGPIAGYNRPKTGPEAPIKQVQGQRVVQSPVAPKGSPESPAMRQQAGPEQGPTSADIVQGKPGQTTEPAREPVKVKVGKEAEAQQIELEPFRQGKLFEDPALSPQVAREMTGGMLAKLPEPFRKLVAGIGNKKISLPGIYKAIENMDITRHILSKIDTSKITGAFSNALEFLREIKLPEIAIIADGIERAGYRLSWKIPEWTKKLEGQLKKSGIGKDKFFADYEAGKYNYLFEKMAKKEKIALEKLTKDELVAVRIKQFTDFFADVFKLKEKIGEHGQPLYRQNYLPHIIIKEISQKMRERKTGLTADELALFNAITGMKFKSVHEIPRYMELPYLTNPFRALDVYGAMATKKMLHDTHLKVLESIRTAVRQLKENAREKLRSMRESEKNLRDAMDRVRDDPKQLKETEDAIGRLRERMQKDPKLNEAGFDSAEKRISDIIDRVTEQSTFEDNIFFKALNAKNPVATFMLNVFLKTPLIKKPFEIREARIVDRGNIVEIVGKIKDAETGGWKERSFTLREFLGKRPLTKILTNYKALSYSSILGMSIPSVLTNLSQTLSFIAQMPGNKFLPFLPSLGSLRAVGEGLAAVMKSIIDPKQRKKYQRSDIFVTMDRLYDGANFNEAFLGKWIDKTLINMKVSELFNRAFTFEMARSILRQKNAKLSPSQKMTPLEIDRLAGELADATNFKYTPLHTEQLLSTNMGKLAFHFGSFFVKQLKLMGGMWKKEWRNPAVQRFYNVMRRGENPRSYLNSLNNSGRMAVMRWLVLTTGLLTAGKALFDAWIWQVDPRRQLFYNPLENPLVQTPFELLAGVFDLVPSPYGNPERGLSKIEKAVTRYIPMMTQARRILRAEEKQEPARIFFSSMGLKKESPEIR